MGSYIAPKVQPSYDFIVCGLVTEISLLGGSSRVRETKADICLSRGGTAGCVVAGRLAEDENVSVLVLEAGPHSETLETVHMVGG
jgi:hypothetical protein